MVVARLYLALDIPPDNSHSFIASSYNLAPLWHLLPLVKRKTLPYFKEFEYLPISCHDEIDRFESVSRQPAPIHPEYITWRYTNQKTHTKFKAEAQNIFNSEKTSTNFVHLLLDPRAITPTEMDYHIRKGIVLIFDHNLMKNVIFEALLIDLSCHRRSSSRGFILRLTSTNSIHLLLDLRVTATTEIGYTFPLRWFSDIRSWLNEKYYILISGW